MKQQSTIIGGCVITAVALLAAESHAFEYVPVHGVLMDADGVPLDGEAHVRFALYEDAVGGTALWSEDRNLDVSAGYFVAYLGEISPLDPYMFSAQATLWLGIRVAEDSEMERISIGGVPYAAHAQYCTYVPEHTHEMDDFEGEIAASSLPGGVVIGPDECEAGQTVVGIDEHGAMQCATFGTGSSSYEAGAGLLLSGDVFSVDSTVVQARIDGSCAEGTAIASVDGDGQVTCQSTGNAAIQAGDGLVLEDNVISVNPSVVQQRLQSNCAEGFALQSVAEDGTVTCVPLTPGRTEGIVYDTGWTAFPVGTTAVFEHAIASDDFVFGTIRGFSYLAGRLVLPAMAASAGGYPPAYVELSENAISTRGGGSLAAIRNLGDNDNVFLNGGDLRLRVVHRAADFDSGWFACAANNTYNWNHQLGVFPSFAILEIAQNDDGTGWRVPTMTTSNRPGDPWRQTSIVVLDGVQAVVRTHGTLAQFTDASGSTVTPTAGHCRLRLFNWQADYDSGWISLSTSAGERDKRVLHNLGVEPSLFMLYVAESTDGTGWCLPAMGAYHEGYTGGVGLYSLDAKWAIIKGGAAHVAHFVNSSGAGMTPGSGFVRFFAWR